MAQPEPEPEPGPRRVATYAGHEDHGDGDEADPIDETEALSPEEELEAYRASLDVPIVFRRKAERRDSHRVEIEPEFVEQLIRRELAGFGVEVPETAVFNVSGDRGACFAWDVDSVLELVTQPGAHALARQL